MIQPQRVLGLFGASTMGTRGAAADAVVVVVVVVVVVAVVAGVAGAAVVAVGAGRDYESELGKRSPSHRGDCELSMRREKLLGTLNDPNPGVCKLGNSRQNPLARPFRRQYNNLQMQTYFKLVLVVMCIIRS